MSNQSPNLHHRKLLNDVNIREELPLRKKRGYQKPETIPVDDTSDSEEFEDVDLNILDDSDEFETIDLENIPKESGNDTLVIRIDNNKKEEKTPKNLISREERHRRVLLHKMYLVMMLVHGSIRNLWCNNKEIARSLKLSCVTPQITQLLENNTNALDQVKSRRLLDGLKKLMTIFLAKFRIISQGIIRKDWDELELSQKSDIVGKRTFRKLACNFRGSRDVAAQTFVTLLRGLGLNARLVFSLQPPDYTKITHGPHPSGHEKSGTPKRKTKTAGFQDSEYPVFWVEVWNKYTRQWVSIDPIVMKLIEVCPKRKKSPFEPPPTDERNQLTYVVAFDKFGRVRDVTRRYSYNYNAKTIRKRIEFRSSEDKSWYLKVLRCCDFKKTQNVADIYEQKEFYDRDLAEGMPNNIQAFKNHPLYALESQLRQDEIIFPKDDTSKCGTFKSKNSSKVFQVYKRSCVHRLRSAKAWYMRGRQLKVGAIPLKSKEEDVRLYAEFQTQLYIPPPVTDGIVPKNQYGNIDVYTKTMLPENSILIECDENCSMKMLQNAANLLAIDYAKAIVSFSFKGKKKKHNITAREGGIVIAKEYEEAMQLTIDNLIEQEEEDQRALSEANALRNWKYFLLKLRLEDRLNKSHGAILDTPCTEELTSNENPESGGFVVSDEEVDEGGFIVSDKEPEEGGFIVSDEEPEDNSVDVTSEEYSDIDFEYESD